MVMAGVNGCSFLDGPDWPEAVPLSAAERLEVFETVWRTVNDAYPDPAFGGVDWRALHDRYRPRIESAPDGLPFYELLQEMLAQLHDSHTHFNRPRLPGEPRRAHQVGLAVLELDGEIVVSEVAAGSAAGEAGIVPGMVVRAVDGKPAREQHRRVEDLLRKGISVSSPRAFDYTARRAFFLGPEAEPAVIELAGAGGETLVVRLPRTKEAPPSLSWRRLPSGRACIRFNLFLPPNDRAFKAALEEVSEAPALIIDLRGNNGGRKEEILSIAGHFFEPGTDLGADVPRSGPAQGFPVAPASPRWRKPVAVLVDEGTASAGEVFAAFLRERAGALIAGRQTSGCVQRAESKKLAGGGTLVYSAYRYRSPDGLALEGTGVVPDLPVEVTLADVRRGRDPALEACERALAEKGTRP
jgi:carboxyl-terminal processing protease